MAPPFSWLHTSSKKQANEAHRLYPFALLLATPAGAVVLSGVGEGTTWPAYDGGGGGLITIVNQRYYADANGNPKFLLGYYSWTTGELDIPMSADRTITGRQMIEDSMYPNGLNCTAV